MKKNQTNIKKNNQVTTWLKSIEKLKKKVYSVKDIQLEEFHASITEEILSNAHLFSEILVLIEMTDYGYSGKAVKNELITNKLRKNVIRTFQSVSNFS